MDHIKRIPARFLQEYLETIAHAQAFQVSNLRNWNLLSCYAELQYKLNGGSKCSICRSTVRHVVPVFVQRLDGHEDSYGCLCTRCFEGERAQSTSIRLKIGEAEVAYAPHTYGHHSGVATKYDLSGVRARAAGVGKK